MEKEKVIKCLRNCRTSYQKVHTMGDKRRCWIIARLWRAYQTHAKGLAFGGKFWGIQALSNQRCTVGRLTGQQCAGRTGGGVGWRWTDQLGNHCDHLSKRYWKEQVHFWKTFGRRNDGIKCQPAGWDESAVCSLVTQRIGRKSMGTMGTLDTGL